MNHVSQFLYMKRECECVRTCSYEWVSRHVGRRVGTGVDLHMCVCGSVCAWYRLLSVRSGLYSLPELQIPKLAVELQQKVTEMSTKEFYNKLLFVIICSMFKKPLI